MTPEFRRDLEIVTAHYGCADEEIDRMKAMVKALADDGFAAMVESFALMSHEIEPRTRWPTISAAEVEAMLRRKR